VENMRENKKFKLFISSTFNDFHCEREVLQTKIFPSIKEYCYQKGYIFQPIDLRWGINEEAQLDQKTLDLCLSEVRSCKGYPYPNFLLMLGDRYGWIPLPYIIESKEFEEIILYVTDKNKKLLLEWYKEDLNQLPASYILQERKGKYVDFNEWRYIENTIRNLFQSIVKKSALTVEQQRKYFLSATDSEIEEGIILYNNPTAYQKKLLLENLELEKIDKEHIFGFFRNIAIESKKSDKFIGEDRYKAYSLKSRVRDELVNDNILVCRTIQIDKDSLDKSYLREFEARVIAFLKNKVDTQIAKEQYFTPLEIELHAQAYFAKQKRQNFIGQENILEEIKSYINSNKTEPFILYGTSGRGKSSIMAKAIEEVKKNSLKKVIYRFVKATPHAGSSKEILTSFFLELGKDIQSQDKKETFENFSYRVYNELMNIKDNLIIFIDAIDQIGHNDQFLWLPNRLPENVKIIISALKDSNYKEDSKYFEILKRKSKNLIEVKIFDQPLNLLYTLLNQENRTLQKYQEVIFLREYQSSATPLYVVVAVQELKYWRSCNNVLGNKESKKIQNLANTQRGIIKDFIINLYTIYHHDKEFVTRLLGYICASEDGLSENELLQLFAIDKEFIQKVAPNTWHENKSGGLPVVIWTRLYTHLKPFLSIKEQDGEKLFYFFHREFKDIVKEYIEIEYKKLIENSEKIIFNIQNNNFYNNRWGKLHIILMVKYAQKYHNNKSLFIPSLTNYKWIEEYCDFLNGLGLNYSKYNKMEKAISHQEFFVTITNSFHDKKWISYHLMSMSNLGISYEKQNMWDKAEVLNSKNLELVKKLYIKNPIHWIEQYTRALHNLALTYNNQNRYDDALFLQKEELKIVKVHYTENPDKWLEVYIDILNNIGNTYYYLGKVNLAIEIGEKNLNYLNPLYRKNPNNWVLKYTKALSNLAGYYSQKNQFDNAIKLEKEANSILELFYLRNPDYWVEEYTRVIGNLSLSYLKIQQKDKSIELSEKCLIILEARYKENEGRWGVDLIRNLGNIMEIYLQENRLDKAEEFGQRGLKIVSKLYHENPIKWNRLYIQILNNLANIKQRKFEFDEALKFQIRCLDISEKQYIKNPNSWAELYTGILINLVNINLALMNINDAKIYALKNLDILLKLYDKNKKQWAKALCKTFSLLSMIYTSLKKFEKAIKYGTIGFKISEEYYLESPHVWTESYLESLYGLSQVHAHKNNLEMLLEVTLKIYKILDNLYLENQNIWDDKYMEILNRLAGIYFEKDEFESGIDFLQKLYSVVLKKFGDNNDITHEVALKLEMMKAE
jgi:hypothetical protein